MLRAVAAVSVDEEEAVVEVLVVEAVLQAAADAAEDVVRQAQSI